MKEGMEMRFPIEHYGLNPDVTITVKEFIAECKKDFNKEQKIAFIDYAKKELL